VFSIRGVFALMTLFFFVSCAGGPHLTTYHRPNAFINSSSPIAIVPAKMGKPDDLVLPDAIATELLGMGLNVVERTTLSQMINERGLDLTEILNGEEYFKLGEVANIQIIVIVSSTMRGGGVANATCKVVDIRTGAIIISTTYDQPRPDQPIYILHQSLTKTAHVIAETIRKSIKK